MPPIEQLEGTTDQLLNALEVYDRFIEGWPYKQGAVPNEVEEFLVSIENSSEIREPLGDRLVTTIKELYHEVRQAEATYIQQTREQDQPDWSRFLSEIEHVREATQRVHRAGYGTDSETGDPGYVLPKELCPAHQVSMNYGSTPITFEKRISQYSAVADHFEIDPEVVYHPGSGHDVSLSETFPESNVIYVDVDEPTMRDLNRAGYEAIGADATGYELSTGADLIVFRNAGLTEEAIVKTNLRPGGWVIANDHLESAKHLTQLESLELVGIVPDTWTGNAPPVHTGSEGFDSTFEEGGSLDQYVFHSQVGSGSR